MFDLTVNANDEAVSGGGGVLGGCMSQVNIHHPIIRLDPL